VRRIVSRSSGAPRSGTRYSRPRRDDVLERRSRGQLHRRNHTWFSDQERVGRRTVPPATRFVTTLSTEHW